MKSSSRLVMEFESECCQIPTVFANPKSDGFSNSFTSDSDSTFILESRHSSQSAISHAEVNNYALNSYLIMSV